MKLIHVIVFAQFLFSAAMLNAQTDKPQKPVKTGNEWKMPGDVVQRSRAFATKCEKKLGLDSMQTRKVFEAYMSNTKPLDEIAVAPVSDKQKEQMVKDNTSAFNEKLKTIFKGEQFSKYIKSEKQ
jgi:hypothetical protein